MTIKDSKKATRELTIITRYQMKKTTAQYAKGTVILVCENDKGERVTVVLRPNKVHSCACDGYVKSHGRHQCYHIIGCVETENHRASVRVAMKKDIATAPLHHNRPFSLLKIA